MGIAVRLGSSATRLAVTAHSHYGFGGSLATGDFNSDGKADLAADSTQTTYIYRGGFAKSGTTGKVTKHVPSPSVADILEPTALVAGKVTKDKAADLYILGQGYKNDKVTQAAWFLRGGTTVKSGKFTTYNGSSPDYSPAGVIADFDKNGYGDLAVNDTPCNNGAGSVVALRGGASGPTTNYRLTQSTSGVVTAATKHDGFGYALSASDTNRDGYPDLAVDVPEEKVGSVTYAGGVHVLRGSKKGLTGTSSQWFTRATAGVPGSATQYSMFGRLYVRLRDRDRDGDADLLISDNGTPSVLLRAGTTPITTGSATEPTLRANFPQ
ncbi:FG-GAP repeat protein [Streptomyces sp. NBC_01356]|uniref:FG-GAP repeat protein n=1 Tax=Streptomyces sp. NBC_01356 TaxID=2903836 RepID=UPI002E381123|nr:FG-GAP repeat protein [Streptomyces sp. NBC_01356]